MSQVTHDNHYVPQMYLKQWSNDGLQVWAYRILVSHDNVPKWTRRSISQVAYFRDLYTDIKDGEEIDEFEKWLEAEFENPAQESIRKVIKDNPLSSLDWERLAKFLGAQDMRTPLNYLESTERWNNTLPHLLQSTLEEAVSKLEQKKNLEIATLPSENTPNLFDDILTIETVTSKKSKTEQGYISAEISTGRKLWLQSQKHLLTNTITTLKNHKWCIVRPARGYQWFTSDHPVVKLNSYGLGKYDLKGGWGKIGGNIFMPISPRHLLFTQIGDYLPDRLTFTSDQTKQIQSLIAERAFRWIFAREQLVFLEKMRPRLVDPEAFKDEEERWKNWHDLQKQAEEHPHDTNNT